MIHKPNTFSPKRRFHRGTLGHPLILLGTPFKLLVKTGLFRGGGPWCGIVFLVDSL